MRWLATIWVSWDRALSPQHRLCCNDPPDGVARDNTLIVFVNDNGWIQESGPRQTTPSWFALKSKLSPYDGGLRTPVILSWPGHTKPGVYDDLVSTVDRAPTILHACGVPPPPAMAGRSLLDRAAGGAALNRDAVFGEIYVHTAGDLHKPALNLTHRWVRAGDGKLILDNERNTAELYDVKNDPFEKHDLSAKQPERVKELSKRNENW